MPHTVALPIELYYPYNKNYYSYSFLINILFNYTITCLAEPFTIKENLIRFFNLNPIVKLTIYKFQER